ncbi:MAG: ATP synthase F1 subunit epsilon [Bdellovibrionales bacterium]|nr:ATP synthase F1 subunit epsilon [Bdellovibrionales bacterium]
MFLLTYVTPEKKVVSDLEVDQVTVPAYRGQLTLLPGHAPLISTLGVGLIKYRPKGKSEEITSLVSWGYCEVNPTGVNILAETAESLEEIDRERAENDARMMQKKLTEPNLEPNQIMKYQRKLQKALARIEASKNV